MGPTRVDALAQARLIIQQCLERDSGKRNAEAEPIRPVIVYDFRRDRGGVEQQGAVTVALPCAGEDRPKPAPPLTLQAYAVLMFGLILCITIAAWFVSHTFTPH